MTGGGRRDLAYYSMKTGYYALFIAAVAAIMYCLYLMAAPIVAAILLSFILDPVVNFLEIKGMRRMSAIMTLYLGLVVILLGVSVVMAPRVLDEAQKFATEFPRYKMLVWDLIDKAESVAKEKFPRAAIPDLNALIAKRFGGGLDIESVVGYLVSFFSFMSIVVLVPILTFFLLADGHLVRKAVLSLIPNRYFEMCVLLFHRVVIALKLFLRGQAIDAAAVGIMTAAGLSVIGMPFALVIGIVAGLGNLIPYLGPIIGAIPAILVLLVTPGWLTVGKFAAVASVFMVVQFIEGTFIYPIAVGKTSNLHPLVVIIGVTVGGQIGGIVGMLVAIPLISVARVSLEVLNFYLKAYSII